MVIAGHSQHRGGLGHHGYRGIWQDGAGHYYIDGNVVQHGEVVVLNYDSETGKYRGQGLE